MIDFNLLLNTLNTNSINLTDEFKRLFHGRGNYYNTLSFLTIDSMDTILNITFYNEIEKIQEDKLFDILIKFIQTSRHQTINLQRRYINKAPSEVIYGVLNDDLYIIEDGIKFNIDLKSLQNNGYFPDMKNGRALIKSIAKDKNVLNLFSYTCGFSLSALKGGAKNVFNIDMSKGALTKGRKNHHLNNLSTKNVQFAPYNILKSFSKIKKYAPYDIIIIDPPTFQKNSFEATKDYLKIIKRLQSIANPNCTILACLNSPFMGENFIIKLFEDYSPTFIFQKRLANCKEFISIDENKSLKNLIFIN
jgi:23S rRNA (cytosine1962-C5)-methyltransferase